MRFFEFATAVTAIGCGTGVIISTVDKVFGARRQQVAQGERQTKQQSAERQRQLEAEVATLRRQNELLQRELEWHTRLLEQGRREPLPGRR